VPVFLAGVAALVAVWLYRPVWLNQPARQFERDRVALRRLLANPDSDPAEVVRLAEQAVTASEQIEGQAGEAYFLLGSALIRVAERAGPQDAWQHWGAARLNLEKAEKLGVPEEDLFLLTYRLGKAGFYAADDPKTVVQRLAKSADLVEHPTVPGDRAERPGEAYWLLTQAYLRLQPPDLEAALAANTKLRTRVAGVREEVLAPARLLSAELNLKLHRVAKARDDLQLITDLAPPDIQVRAHMLRARSYQEEGRWRDAASHWQALLEDKSLTPPNSNDIRYQLGVCYQRLKQPEEAAHLWEECLRGPGGEEVAAAAVALAEVRLQGPRPESALEALTLALQPVKSPGDWHNSLVSADKVREVVEAMIQSYRQAGKLDLALAAAEAYHKLAVAPRAAILRAEVATEWARALHNQARQAKPSETLKADEEGIRGLFVRAGAAYAEAAEVTRPALEHADLLYLSGLRYLEGQDFTKAFERLEQARKLEESAKDTLPPDKVLERQARLGEIWFHLGEARRQQKERELAAAANTEERRQLKTWEDSLAAYSECTQYPTPFTHRARYQLSLLLIETRELDRAKDILTQNVTQLRKEPEPDAEVLEQSLFALGGVLYRQRNYGEAISRFEDALQMVRRRDDAGARAALTPEVALARYHLADSYLQMYLKLSKDAADGSQSRDNQEHFRQEARTSLQKADNAFRELEQLLQTPEGKGYLTEVDRLDVAMSVADCQFYLSSGNYEAARELYEKLIQRLTNELNAVKDLGAAQRDQCEYLLQALSRTIGVYAAYRKPEYVQQRVADTRKVLEQVKPALTPEKYEEWQKWLEVASGSGKKSEK
jgi:tetratricopeptide (TPR) repeat protein